MNSLYSKIDIQVLNAYTASHKKHFLIKIKYQEIKQEYQAGR
jgi:hypothetical protein